MVCKKKCYYKTHIVSICTSENHHYRPLCLGFFFFFGGGMSPTPKNLTIRKPRSSDHRPCVPRWSVNRGGTVLCLVFFNHPGTATKAYPHLRSSIIVKALDLVNCAFYLVNYWSKNTKHTWISMTLSLNNFIKMTTLTLLNEYYQFEIIATIIYKYSWHLITMVQIAFSFIWNLFFIEKYKC